MLKADNYSNADISIALDFKVNVTIIKAMERWSFSWLMNLGLVLMKIGNRKWDEKLRSWKVENLK